jgi:hypothetical protein
MWKKVSVDSGKSSGPINHNELALLQLKEVKTQKKGLLKKLGKTLWMNI